jgi:hypothetical protein
MWTASKAGWRPSRTTAHPTPSATLGLALILHLSHCLFRTGAGSRASAVSNHSHVSKSIEAAPKRAAEWCN